LALLLAVMHRSTETVAGKPFSFDVLKSIGAAMVLIALRRMDGHFCRC
jgi:hypothetical protein